MGLVALCVGANVLEASLLAVVGPVSALALAPQASALVPFGGFHDLRWLLVYSRSWPGVAVEGLLLLCGRSLVTALSVRAAWPATLPAPSLGRCLARAGLFTLAAELLLLPFAVLLFALAVVPVSWFWLAAVPGALIVAVLFHHGAIAPGWWRRGLSVRAIGWILADFAAASVAGAIISAVPVAWGVVVAGVAGLANAWTWWGLVGSTFALAEKRRFRPVAPLGLVSFAGLVVGGTALGFAAVAPAGAVVAAGAVTSSDSAQSSAYSPAVGGSRGVAVLVVAGYGTSWDGKSASGLAGPYLQRRFSYRGLGPDGSPLPYASGDTNQTLMALEWLMATQVAALHRTAHKPVAIVAESEGSLIAKTYLATSRPSFVRYLIMTSPLVQPGRVYYPPAGATGGWGLAGRGGMAVIASAIKSVAPIPLSPTSPFLRSIVTQSNSLPPLLSCPRPGVTEVAILPLADALASPDGRHTGIPTMVIPSFHGGMLTNTTADAAIRAVLDGRPLPRTPGWSTADRVMRAAASAWQVPSLARRDRPAASPCGGSSRGLQRGRQD